MYSNKEYQNLIFYGGSCLRYCFDLPRLSEDLDFINLNKKKIDLNVLAKDVKNFFEQKFNLKISVKIQNFRIYLKLPILNKLNLAHKPESNFLIIKIKISENSEFLKNDN